ncbi:hypothetical protein CBE01nite_19080 [Clostridium beijerinckii]|uniref:Uncharacterized protein n=1 Tax=Clostridium beijerinckii TaxID=1520 RepID=A0AB74V9R8_CLOBE|nr:hypothetical protein [Clostridium beijerinckii]NRZ27336.1 hypothetical protein [Clostridium beijerinckii]NYB96872.1 hypothetical protein [Clostridium beijerinckii]OOM22335.1 hypothetical protein CLBEI_33380 [Clostridium beijerinckii]QUN33183.1 hypothetical protein KEC93_14380 [Clostridium beijerinckii]SQB11723.1 Uncharacterised protein [Clostridium beijerinckii]
MTEGKTSRKDFDDQTRVDVYIAYKLSILLQCKTITDGTYYGDDSSEYWNIIFDKGEPSLADDLETEFLGDGDGKVKIIRRMALEELKLIR